MTYQEIEAYLYQIPKFTSKNDLEHTRFFLEQLGNPGVNIPRIHVAGTNGKGSVCAYLQSLFRERGVRTGAFISPHLVSVLERFLINQEMVSEPLFSEAFSQVKAAADEGEKRGIAHPTFFEFLFLMGMYIFDKEKVEILILETGLGGRLDATNSLDGTDVCVITEIGLDHCQYLGDTREKIAGEKAGIIKQNAATVYCDRADSTSAVIEKVCKDRMSDGIPVGENDYKVEKVKYKSIDFSYKSLYYNNISLTVSTPALYQVENASIALRAFEAFEERKQMTPMSEKKMRDAVSHTFWEGRMEEVMPGVFFDGAHNEDGMKAFLESAAEIPVEGKRILCFSAVSDKAFAQMISMLSESHLFSQVVAVEMEEERGIHRAQLETQFSQYNDWQVQYAKGTEEGISLCSRLKGEKDQVFIVGSLYLIGLVKAVIRRKSS